MSTCGMVELAVKSLQSKLLIMPYLLTLYTSIIKQKTGQIPVMLCDGEGNLTESNDLQLL